MGPFSHTDMFSWEQFEGFQGFLYSSTHRKKSKNIPDRDKIKEGIHMVHIDGELYIWEI